MSVELILESLGEKDVATARALPQTHAVPEDWHAAPQEGQLSVDVAETKTDIAVVATMAGTEPDEIRLSIHNDLLTIRGRRFSPLDGEAGTQYFYTECFWGAFSRTIVLPIDVKGELAHAEYHRGVLIVRIPKERSSADIPIMVVDE